MAVKASKRKRVSQVIVGFILYVMCSATGLVLIKKGINAGFKLSVSNGIFDMSFGLILLVGAMLYVISFLLSITVMSKMNLTYFYPLSAGLIYILVCILGVFFLGERIVFSQFIGMALILAGVVVMNLKNVTIG